MSLCHTPTPTIVSRTIYSTAHKGTETVLCLFWMLMMREDSHIVRLESQRPKISRARSAHNQKPLWRHIRRRRYYIHIIINIRKARRQIGKRTGELGSLIMIMSCEFFWQSLMKTLPKISHIRQLCRCLEMKWSPLGTQILSDRFVAIEAKLFLLLQMRNINIQILMMFLLLHCQE